MTSAHQRHQPHQGHQRHQAQLPPQHASHYRRLLAMLVLSYIAMYVLMYAMVDTPGNVFNNVNQVYMAGLMAAPMLLIELALMGAMYPRKALNAGLAATSVIIMALCWSGIRQQAAVSDQQFLRSMIPHHAGALLMCGKNHLADPELQQLCRDILASQQREIDQMKAKLE